MNSREIHVAQDDEQDAVLDTLMLAFGADPCMRYLFQRADVYAANFKRFAGAMGGKAFVERSAYVAGDGGVAALWLPPGVPPDSDTIGEVIAAVAPPERLPVLAEVGEAMAQYHPHEPHWYLALIGVDPSRQGQGLGSAMLKQTLRRCDADGVMAYLESSNPKNVPLYERHGFEVIGVVQPRDFPPLTPMLRAAR